MITRKDFKIIQTRKSNMSYGDHSKCFGVRNEKGKLIVKNISMPGCEAIIDDELYNI